MGWAKGIFVTLKGWVNNFSCNFNVGFTKLPHQLLLNVESSKLSISPQVHVFYIRNLDQAIELKVS